MQCSFGFHVFFPSRVMCNFPTGSSYTSEIVGGFDILGRAFRVFLVFSGDVLDPWSLLKGSTGLFSGLVFFVGVG